jgi:fatty acid desaturase
MGQKLREKVLDFTDAGWRERPLMASMLAHQKRIRTDPEIQRIRDEVDRESRREWRSVFLVLLLLPIAVWSIYAGLVGFPWNLALMLVAAWAFCVGFVYLLTR